MQSFNRKKGTLLFVYVPGTLLNEKRQQIEQNYEGSDTIFQVFNTYYGF